MAKQDFRVPRFYPIDHIKTVLHYIRLFWLFSLMFIAVYWVASFVIESAAALGWL